MLVFLLPSSCNIRLPSRYHANAAVTRSCSLMSEHMFWIALSGGRAWDFLYVRETPASLLLNFGLIFQRLDAVSAVVLEIGGGHWLTLLCLDVA